MKQVVQITTVLLASSAMACSGAENELAHSTEDTSPDLMESEQVTEQSSESTGRGLSDSVLVEPVTLNEFETRGEEIEFIRIDGDEPTFLMSFARPANIREGLTEALRREHPGLTLLETFYALAPEDEVPHADLIEFHVAQTEILERDDDAIRFVDFDVNRPVEKITAQFCTDQIIANTPPGEIWHADRLNSVNKPNGGDLALLCPAWQGQAGCNHQSSGGTHIVISCNDGPSRIASWYAYRRNDGPWRESALHFELVPNQFRGWLLPPHQSGLFPSLQVFGIFNDDIHLAGETPPSYFSRAGYSF